MLQLLQGTRQLQSWLQTMASPMDLTLMVLAAREGRCRAKSDSHTMM